MRIKDRAGRVIYEAECDSLKAAVLKACDVGVNLSFANLHSSDLSWLNLRDARLFAANLGYSDLTGTDFRFANLTEANLISADLSGAMLRYADMDRARFTGANLTKTQFSWQSHDLIAEVLFRNANDKVDNRKVAAFIKTNTLWCWGDFLALGDPLTDWALNVLANYVQEDDGAPAILRERAATLSRINTL